MGQDRCPVCRADGETFAGVISGWWGGAVAVGGDVSAGAAVLALGGEQPVAELLFGVGGQGVLEPAERAGTLETDVEEAGQEPVSEGGGELAHVTVTVPRALTGHIQPPLLPVPVRRAGLVRFGCVQAGVGLADTGDTVDTATAEGRVAFQQHGKFLQGNGERPQRERGTGRGRVELAGEDVIAGPVPLGQRRRTRIRHPGGPVTLDGDDILVEIPRLGTTVVRVRLGATAPRG
ncbi:hypothetical protein ACF08M_23605 [Streptomyces sp. NPDC015032]|uniref:hypothetical protein n=1 Tax=Streptomyces sp. NPDC015032 TaxID=3364937 RepID=UPI0036FDC526